MAYSKLVIFWLACQGYREEKYLGRLVARGTGGRRQCSSSVPDSSLLGMNTIVGIYFIGIYT